MKHNQSVFRSLFVLVVLFALTIPCLAQFGTEMVYYELNKANNVDYSDELYVYHNVYLGKFPKAYKDISYKIYDDIDIYKTINSYEQVFDNIEAVNYYKDIYNQIIFEYKIN